MGYTAEMLASLSDTDLDGVVEELILGKEPEPGLLTWLGKSMTWKAPEDLGPTTQAGLGRLMEAMLDRGFTLAVAPGGVVWSPALAGNGNTSAAPLRYLAPWRSRPCWRCRERKRAASDGFRWVSPN
jgi:hypothetical protein